MDINEMLSDLLGSNSNLMQMGAAGLIVCLILTLVLTIVIFVVLVPHEHTSGHKGAKGFFNFDVLIVAPVFKFIYILLAVALIVFGLVAIVMTIVQAIRYSIPSLALGALTLLAVVVGGEIVLRLVCELIFLMVKLVGDVTVIKDRLSHIDAGRQEQQTAWPNVPPQVYATPNAAAYDTQQSYQQTYATASYAPQDTVAYTANPVPMGYAAPETSDPTTVMADLDVTAVQPLHQTASPASASAEASAGSQQTQQVAEQEWTCSCGQTGNTGNFCTRCGRPRP